MRTPRQRVITRERAVQRVTIFIGLFLGTAALIVGVAGLLTPVRVSPEEPIVDCGSAVIPDLSEARAMDDGNSANVLIGNEVVADTNFTRLCQMELTDRRMWTISLVAVGVLAIGGTLVLRSRWKRAAPLE